MKKFSLLLVFLILSFLITPALAYNIKSNIPGTKTLTWYTHNTLTSTQKTAATNAATTWNNASSGMTLSRSGDSSGTITIGDTRSDFAYCDISGFPGVSSNTAAVTYTVGSGYKNFDILMNINIAWGSGNSSSYLDREGVSAHELGHALGLDEGSTSPTGWISPEAYYTPTMYPSSTFNGTPVSYYQRTLESDDINGVKAVAARIQ